VSFDAAKVPGTGYEAAQIETFIDEGKQAADAALAPASALLDDSPARKIAGELRDRYDESIRMYRDIVEQRQKFEADTLTRPEVLQERWAEISTDYETRAKAIHGDVWRLRDELTAALQQEALPVPTDSPSIQVARDEILLAVRTAKKRNQQPFQAMAEAASRGGNLAAVAASEWGRMTLEEAAGSDTGFEHVRTTAIRTSLTGDDERRRRAAAALQAATSPRPGGRGEASYEASMLNTFVMGVGEKAAKSAISPHRTWRSDGEDPHTRAAG
jgi:hypothetical protein